MEKKIPKLRFPEFDGEWVEKKLGEVAERVTRKNRDNNLNVLTISAQLGLISQLEFFNKSVSAKDLSGYYLLHKNDFAYNKSYSNGYPMGAIKRLNRYEKGVVSTLYICFKINENFDDTFAEQYFETGKQNPEIEKVAQEGARNHGLLNIGVNDFFNIEIKIPALPEQTKISNFLSAVDDKITHLKKKKELLEQYKKGVMQKIFSQELRFKDENGEDFAEWEEKKLGEILIEHKTKNINKHVEEVFSVAKNKGVINQIEHLGRSYASNDTSNYKVVFPNDVVYTKSPTSDFPFGIIKQNMLERTGIVSVLYGVFTPKNKYIGLLLDYYFSNWKNTYNYLNPLVQKGAKNTMNIGNEDFLNGAELLFPSSEAEQTKIANFLSAIDDKINHCGIQIEKMEAWKKGLLQQMFV